MVHDPCHHRAYRARCGLIYVLVRCRTKDCHYLAEWTKSAPHNLQFPGESRFAQYDPKKRNRWAFLRESTAEIDAQVK
jgi:hypothetical protein